MNRPGVGGGRENNDHEKEMQSCRVGYAHSKDFFINQRRYLSTFPNYSICGLRDSLCIWCCSRIFPEGVVKALRPDSGTILFPIDLVGGFKRWFVCLFVCLGPCTPRMGGQSLSVTF